MNGGTGEIRPPHLIRDSIIDKLDDFNDKVWKLSSKEEMEEIPTYILFRTRLVLCNKGDAESPDVRARLVGWEVNKGGGKVDVFYASTPQFKAKSMLLSQSSSEQARKNKPLRISFVDVRKA